MTRTSFMVGISALAFAASAASAQTSDTTDANGNRAIRGCVTGTATTCTVDNSGQGQFQNTGSVGSRNGTNNSVSVVQRGNRQNASVDADGTANNGFVDQTGNNNSATIGLAGTNSTSTTIRAATNATVRQRNNDNSATIVSTRSGTPAANTNNQSTINQGIALIPSGTGFADGQGSNNVARSAQNGSTLVSTITQNAAFSSGTTQPAAASFNFASANQTGTGSSSEITQTSRANSATVTLGGGGVNDGNVVRQNSSRVTQSNTRVRANATTGAFEAGAPTQGSTFASNNAANVAIIGLQNSSTVLQDGRGNSATVSILGGGTGNTSLATTPDERLPDNRPEGNQSTINQYGINNVANVSAGGRTQTNPNGRGNLSEITQGTVGDINNLGNARNMTANVYQRGTGDTVQITQNNNLAGVDGARQDGSFADVSQLSLGSIATVNQSGTNRAEVAQGLNADNTGSNLTIEIDQIDAGDTVGTPADGGGFGGGSDAPVTAQRNLARSSQSGINNSGTITQNTVNGSASLFQARLSRDNVATIAQGNGAASDQVSGPSGATGATSVNLVADVTQRGVGGSVTALQDGTNNAVTISQDGAGEDSTVADPVASNNSVTVRQVAQYNAAFANQTGFNLDATITQEGTGTASRTNVARVTQTGSDHSAVIEQTANAGVSPANSAAAGPDGTNAAFPNARPAGSYAAEAIILQSSTGNSASIRQDGLGQYARIEQTGSDNEGRILQNTGATNAVAILEQSGTGNSLQITQDFAGQYIRVQQTGNNNAVTTTEFARSPATNGGTLGPVDTGAPAIQAFRQ